MRFMRFVLGSIVVVPLIVAGCSGSSDTPSVPTAPTALSATPAITSAPSAGSTTAATTAKGGRAAATGVIFVTSQGRYFDTFVPRDPLPMEGRFQLLRDTDGDGVGDTTEFGPGDPGYLGGRWWVDLNGNGMQDSGDHFFLCPLLPPGRTTP